MVNEKALKYILSSIKAYLTNESTSGTEIAMGHEVVQDLWHMEHQELILAWRTYVIFLLIFYILIST